jgi:putative Holliday junction resolvase
MPDAGTVLAFDFGEKRIGVAVGDIAIGIAHPLQTVTGKNTAERFAVITALVAEWKPVRLVVGLPLALDGTEHELTRLCRRFARRLQGRFGLPVEMVDERLTSVEADQALNETGVRGRGRKAVLDQVAAQRILQSYFDAHATA